MFAYCNNNPVNLADPAGNCPVGFIGPCPGPGRCKSGAMGKITEKLEAQQKARLDNEMKRITEESSTLQDIFKSVGVNVASGVADAYLGSLIEGISTYKKTIGNIPSFGPAFEITTIKKPLGRQLLKRAGAVGVVTIALYGYDVYQDYQKYGSNAYDFGTALAITTMGTAFVVGTGMILTGLGAPVGVVIISGALIGVGTYYGTDWAKRQMIGY